MSGKGWDPDAAPNREKWLKVRDKVKAKRPPPKPKAGK